MNFNSEKILTRLKGSPKKDFPSKYELRLRAKLAEIIEACPEENKAIEKIVDYLNEQKSAQYAYERSLAYEYYEFFIH